MLALLIMIAIYLMNLWLSHPFKAAEKGRLDIVRFHIWLGGDINDSTRFRMSSEKNQYIVFTLCGYGWTNRNYAMAVEAWRST